MQIGEAVVSGASQGPKGAQEVEFKAVCSMADCERLNVIAGEWRAAVNLDRVDLTQPIIAEALRSLKRLICSRGATPINTSTWLILLGMAARIKTCNGVRALLPALRVFSMLIFIP